MYVNLLSDWEFRNGHLCICQLMSEFPNTFRLFRNTDATDGRGSDLEFLCQLPDALTAG